LQAPSGACEHAAYRTDAPDIATMSHARTTSDTRDAEHAEARANHAFDAGVLEFAGRLRAFIRKRVSDPADAEDLAQEVLLKVFRARGSLRDPRKLEAWLYQTARTAVIDYYRRRRPADELPAGLTDESAVFDEVGERMRRSVRRFLATLPELYRHPLSLAEFEGRSVAEIARELHLSESAVKSRLTRGRALLREKLLGCCRFEFDPFGKIIDFQQKVPCGCETPDDTETAAGTATAAPAQHAVRSGVPVRIELALAGDEPAIRELLSSAGLPTADLTSDHFLSFLTAKTDGHLVGCAGIEVAGTAGLLRSVAVVPGLRGSGVGRGLVAAAERLAQQLGLAELFLLTNTAEAFFARLGYERVQRAIAPDAIRATTEYSSLCPASSAFMRKRL
jgi:RNA polymerase sigma factor (SigZ family)